VPLPLLDHGGKWHDNCLWIAPAGQEVEDLHRHDGVIVAEPVRWYRA